MTVASNSVHQGNSRVAKLGGTVCVVLKTEEIKSAAATIVITNGARGSDNAIIAELTYPFSKLIKDDASPAQLKLDEPIRLYFPLKEATNRRLAKINIYRAENLYTPKGSPPSPFCAVYLLNNQRDRIRMFKKELLTSVVKKSSNPVWDAEIELQGPLGIEGVAFVVVQIRDHGMTGLDPKPLGQVVIPISTFMFGKDDGQVTLPIEPTDRMAKVARGTGAAPLGTLVFHAELADLPASGVRRPTSQQLLTGNAILDCTLRTSAAEGTWWPMKLLSEAAEERTSLPSGGGYLACGFDSLLLHFLRPEGGAVSGLPVKECLRGKDVIAVPWSQVKTIVAVTDSAAVPDNLDAVITWYLSILIDDVKALLVRLIDHSKVTKALDSPLPWDIDLANPAKKSSSLPETLRAAFDIYLDLRVEKPAPDAPDEERERAKRINDRILRPIGQCFMLLVQDYKKAVAARNWVEIGSSISPAPGSYSGNTSIAFLCSIANDCYRLSTVHMDSFSSTAILSSASDDVAVTLVGEYSSISESVLKTLSQMLLSDFRNSLADFDKLWNTQQTTENSVAATITAALGVSLREMKPLLETALFAKLVSITADTCLSRFLLFLKNKSSLSGSSGKLNAKQLAKLKSDVAAWTTCFSGVMSGVTDTSVSSKLSVLSDYKDLVVLDYTTPQYLELVSQYARKYSVEGRAAMIRFLSTSVNLREEGGFRLQQAIDKAIEKFKNQAAGGAAPPGGLGAEVDLTEDILVKNFGEVSDKATKSSGFKMFGKKAESPSSAVSAAAGAKRTSMSDAGNSSLGTDGEESVFEFDHVSDTESTVYGDSGSEVGDMYTLEIVEVQVRGLKSVSLFGKANPYVKFAANSQRVKTSVKWNCNSATWEEVLSLPIMTSNMNAKFINAAVYDKERVRRKRLLGSAKIPLEGILSGQVSNWFRLEGAAGGFVDGNNGELFVKIRLSEGKGGRNDDIHWEARSLRMLVPGAWETMYAV
eukprot:gene1292-1465_t